MSPAPLRSLTILGSGHEGWLIAHFLHRKLGPVRPEIAVIEVEGDDGPAGLSTLPGAVEWLSGIGFNPVQLAAGTGGALKLGESFTGVSTTGADAFLPFGNVGAAAGPVQFHQQLARLGLLNPPQNYAGHALSTRLAKAGRFMGPLDDPRSIRAGLAFGLHLDARALRDALKQAGARLGIAHQASQSVGFERDDDGRVTRLQLDDGLTRESDFIIDTRAEARTDKRWRPTSLGAFDRVAETSLPRSGDLPPFTINRLAGDAWVRQIPLKNRSGISALLPSSLDAQSYLSDIFGCDVDLTSTPALAGRCTQPWMTNYLRMGAAAWRVPALAGADVTLLTKACDRLLQVFPHSGPSEAEAIEYNRLMGQEVDTALDFAHLLLVTQTRTEAVWQSARAITPSGNVQGALDLFRSRGRLMLDEFCHHGEDIWIAALLAMGVVPARHDPQADALEETALRARIARIDELVSQAPATSLSHDHYLDRVRGELAS